MEVSSVDSTNSSLNVRFDLLKDWVVKDSLICTLTLDPSKTYLQKFEDWEKSTLRYYSSSGDVTVYLCVPTTYEYDFSNGMHGVSYQFDYCKIDLPGKWRKYQKGFRFFYEK